MAVVLPAFKQAEPEGIELVQLAYLTWLEGQEAERFEKYKMFRDYYEGEHAAQLTARIRKFLELQDSQEFSLNFCPIVVDALAEKLKVASFDCGKDKMLAELTAAWWEFNRMDAQQGVVHTAAVRDGDTYVLVEWDNEEKMPRFTQENAYDGSEGLHLVYSDERRRYPVVAIKRWTINEPGQGGQALTTKRTNLYYPDRIEKYTDYGRGGAWQPYGEPGEEWPIPWTDTGRAGGQPLGISVVHWRNKDQGYSYGESELEDVVPLSNAGNKSVLDLLGAADTNGFPIFTGTGWDGTGKTVAPGIIWWSTDPAASFGSIPAGDLNGLIALKDSITADIGKVSRTPLSFFQLTGQVAAAGTLKEQREGLNAKIADRQTCFGNAWEDVMAIGRRLHNVWGSGTLDVKQRISTTWVDPEAPTPKERADEVDAATRAGAMSTATKVRTLHPDWDDDRIDAEVALIRDEMGLAVPEIGPVA